MKSTFAIICLAICGLIACTRPVPPQQTPKAPLVASNLQFHPGYVWAEFENGEMAVVYYDGSASVLLPAKGQFDFEGKFQVDDTGYFCLNNQTGDYLHIRRSGFASGKVNGMAFNLMPGSSQAAAR